MAGAGSCCHLSPHGPAYFMQHNDHHLIAESEVLLLNTENVKIPNDLEFYKNERSDLK